MSNFKFTLFKHAQDINGEPVSKSWNQWIEAFSIHKIRGSKSDSDDKEALDRNKNGPAIILGHIPRDKPRKASSVASVHALSLDIEDHSDAEIEAALAPLNKYEYFVWTTHKHGSKVVDGKARLRVIIPLEEALAPNLFSEAWSRLDHWTNRINDPSTKDISRLNFLPSTFDAGVAWTYNNKGRFLAFDDLPEIQHEPTIDSPSSDKHEIKKTLKSIENKIRYLAKEDDFKEPLTKLSKGEAFAEPGERHKTILDLTIWLVWQDKSLDRATLEALFEPSLRAMSTQAGAPTINEIVTAYQGAIEKNKEYKLKEQARRLNSGPYSTEDLARIAQVNNWTTAELLKRWILQKDGSVWILSESGDYVGPFSKEDARAAVTQYLSRAPVRIIEITRNGHRLRPIVDIVCERGTVLNNIVSDLTAERTYFDTKTLEIREAILPVRDLTPEFNPEIDQWLKLLGGQQYLKLLDWLSCAPDLNKLLCAIYFDGAPSSGKTMFAHGVAKLWTDGPPAEIKEVLGNFNDELVRCPLILADEEIPTIYHQSVTASLRSMLSTTSRTLKRKYRPTSELRGAIRLVLAANNEFLLKSNDVASSQDLEAIAQRFLYIYVGQEAADFLATIPREVKEQWIESGIARHALYLAKNHKIENPGRRFYVEGDVSQMHRLLMTGSKWNSICCEWLVKYLLNPEKFDSLGSGLIRRQDGELLVNDQALSEGWDLYLKTKLDCETAKVGAALRAISKSQKRRQLRWNNERYRYREIDVEHLISWSDQYGIGTEKIIRARLQPSGGQVVGMTEDNKSPEEYAEETDVSKW